MPSQAERLRVPRGSATRIKDHQEQFQIAWIGALAAASGCIVWHAQSIDDGIDILLQHKHQSHTAYAEQSVMLAIQLKATVSAPSGGYVRASASRKRLREYVVDDPTVNTIVAVLTMPREQVDWLRATDTELQMYGACYWVNLAGATVGVGEDDDRITIKAPLDQLLDDVSLAQIMERIGKGGRP